MKFLFIALLCLPVFAFAQSSGYILDCDYPIEKVKDGEYKVIIKDFDELQTSESCFLSWMNTGKGKPDGKLFVYDTDGNKRRMSIYKNGIRVGTHLTWYETGELQDETTWETDLYFNSKSYYKSGKILHTAVDGNRETVIFKSYYENGQLQSENVWQKGIDKWWYENGQIKSDCNSKANTYREWHENGQIKMQGNLRNNALSRIGKWEYYDETGKLLRELTYDETNRAFYLYEEGYVSEKKY